jgi:tellurite methyltransferase
VKKGLGQYDLEYSKCDCFWGDAPGKYVRMLTSEVSVGKVLDLGAGEGKNAIYLASLGFDVVAIDCSEPALKNFHRRLASEPTNIAARIQIGQADVRSYTGSEPFDVVVAYGLLHCLPSRTELIEVVRMMQDVTRVGGVNVIVTFTNGLPIPEVQSYLEPTLLDVGELESFYSEWDHMMSENAMIEETHPTTLAPHKHSVCRLMVRKKAKI